VLYSLGNIAMGAIAAAIGFIVGAMKLIIPVILDFFARLLNISGIIEAVKNIIAKIAAPIHAAINKVIDWVVGWVKKLFGKGDKQEKPKPAAHSPEVQEKVDAGIADLRTEESKHEHNGKITHEEAAKIASFIKGKHSVFSKFYVVDGGHKWNYKYAASPEVEIDGGEKAEGGNKIPFKEGDYIKAKYIDGFWVAKIKKITEDVVIIVFEDTRKGEKTFSITEFIHDISQNDITAYVPDKRGLFMGSNPDRNGGIGQQVRKYMGENYRKINEKEEIKNYLPDHDNKWYPIEENDLSHHPISAVQFWNEEGYQYGPKSNEVRAFMNNAKNYIFEYYKDNRSRGSKEKQQFGEYKIPLKDG
jgi:hypothetical protein